MPSKNLFYGIRMDGTFREVRTRTVPRQEKPYTPLVEVTKSQPIFSFENTEGTLAGFGHQIMRKVLVLDSIYITLMMKEAGADMFSTMLLTDDQICQKAPYAFSTSETADFMAAELSRKLRG